MSNKPIVFTPHDKQVKAFLSKKRFIALIAGVRGGKTHAAAAWSASETIKLYQYDSVNRNGLISAPTHKMILHATLPKFFEMLPQMEKYYKSGAGEIVLPPMRIKTKRGTTKLSKIGRAHV